MDKLMPYLDYIKWGIRSKPIRQHIRKIPSLDVKNLTKNYIDPCKKKQMPAGRQASVPNTLPYIQ